MHLVPIAKSARQTSCPSESAIWLGLSAVVLMLDAVSARAQTQLPGIVVTAPSPVTRPKPAPAAKAATPSPLPKQAAPAPAPAATAAPAQAPEPPPSLEAPPTVPGTLIVADDAFAPVTVVTDRDLLAKQGPTLTDTLQTKPGILGSTFAPGANRPIVRGLDNHRVRVQENGVGTHDVSAISEDHAVPVDPFAAERIEVVRGPATLRYGSQAIGGVVAAENNRIPSFIPKNGISGEIKGGMNSVDDGRDGGFQVTAGAGNFALHADAFKRRTFDYDTSQGRQVNTFVDSEGFSVGGSFIWRDGFAGLSFTRFNSLYGIPGADAATERPRIDLHQEKLQSKGEWRVRDYGIEVIRYWFGATRYAHNEVVFDEVEARDIIGTRFTNRQTEARAEVQHLPVKTALGELRGAVGLQWDRKRTAGFAVEEVADSLLDPAARQQAIAGFIFEELQVTKQLRLQAAARIEQNKADGTGIEDAVTPSDPERLQRSFRSTSGSVGMLYELPMGIVARLTGQYTERAPDIAELFSKGIHEATGTFEIGNPNLAVEKARTVEFGFKRAKGDLRFDTSFYRTSYSGFIYKNFTGAKCDDDLASCGAGSELDQVVYGQRDATFYGADLSGQLDVAPLWRGVWGIEGQYDFVRAQFSDGVNVPRIPPHRVGAGIYYRDTNWFARIAMLHALRQDVVSTIDPKDTVTNGYTLLNAELSYTWKQEQDGRLVPAWTVGIKGENLLDDDVRNHVSFKKDEVLQPGRTVRLFSSVKF